MKMQELNNKLNSTPTVGEAIAEVNENGIIENTGIVTISLPRNLIENIDNITSNETMLYKAQTYFLLWLINRGDKMIGQSGFKNNTYQLHINAHRKIISTKNRIESIIHLLIDNNIIKCIGDYSVNDKKAKTYSLNTPFHMKNKANELIHFDTSIYAFAKNFQHANYLILPLDMAKKADKLIKTWNKKEDTDGNGVEYLSIIEKLQKQIEQQNKIILDLQESLKQIKEINVIPTVQNEVKIETNTVTPYEKYIIELKNSGVNDFETVFQKCYEKFVPIGTHEQIENEISSIIFDTIEEILK